MLKSICIKTNNKKTLSYLLKEFENLNSQDIYLSRLKFSKYNNVVIHYKGINLDQFYNDFSE